MLFHIGRKEVDCLIDLMEPEFSEPMLFVREDGTVQDNTFDPAQVWGVQSTVPKSSVPLALQDVRSPDGSAFWGKWTFALGVSNTIGHLYSFYTGR